MSNSKKTPILLTLAALALMALSWSPQIDKNREAAAQEMPLNQKEVKEQLIALNEVVVRPNKEEKKVDKRVYNEEKKEYKKKLKRKTSLSRTKSDHSCVDSTEVSLMNQEQLLDSINTNTMTSDTVQTVENTSTESTEALNDAVVVMSQEDFEKLIQKAYEDGYTAAINGQPNNSADYILNISESGEERDMPAMTLNDTTVQEESD